MNDLLKLAIQRHGGAPCWKQISRFREIEPRHEDGPVWRSLLATYPDTVVAHHRQQTYHFDDAGLLRRLDYSVDILRGGPEVRYPSEYRELDGIMVPAHRRVHVRNPDGSRSATQSRSPSISPTSPAARTTTMRADIVPGGIGPDYELWGARTPPRCRRS
jgi:hypothetical protein